LGAIVPPKPFPANDEGAGSPAAPKSKAKAAGKAGGVAKAKPKPGNLGAPATSPNDPLKGRGAPLRDLVEVTETRVREFASMDDDVNWMADMKAHVRNAARLEKDIEARILKLEEGTKEWKQYKTAGKISHVLHTVSTAYSRAGAYSQALTRAMDEGDHYLGMEPFPVTTFTFPVFLRQQRHEMQAIGSIEVEFWPMVGLAQLQDVGYNSLQTAQTELIAQKITAVGEVEATSEIVLRAFQKFFAPAVRDHVALHAEVEREVLECEAMAFHADYTSKEELMALQITADRAQEVDCKLLQAFKSSTGGKKLCELVSAHIETATKQLKKLGQLLAYIKRLDEYASGDFVPTYKQWVELSSAMESDVKAEGI
jgi:hypothetical protein